MTGTWLPLEQYIATLPKATVYACLYVTDEAGRPLQLRSALNPDTWQWPGGNMDAGEDPWECAVRECREETGLHIADKPHLMAAHFLPPLGNWTTHKIGFIFDGGHLSQAQIDSIVLDPTEHSDFSVRSVRDWKNVMDPASFQRLTAVAEARRTGTARYVKHTDPLSETS
ncbi:NUDIX domain-containing protein [Streptomyces chrestomyceticus]|uniref:NUDIX domain-containing protein n=1 Tax=Streptomyces chrestomyceticus TaxID=68185 RepID=UPI00368A6EC5